MMEILIDKYGNEVVFITNEDGSTLSMLKSTYDAMEQNQAVYEGDNQ